MEKHLSVDRSYLNLIHLDGADSFTSTILKIIDDSALNNSKNNVHIKEMTVLFDRYLHPECYIHSLFICKGLTYSLNPTPILKGHHHIHINADMRPNVLIQLLSPKKV